ncbi:MAG: T9SS type A sorting domain-containing protein [Bacteroidota bacterium]
MKKVLLFVFFNSVMQLMQAQIVITSGNMPVAGNIIPLQTATTLNGIDVTLTGASYAWDYAALTSASVTIDTFLSVFSTPITYNIAYSNPFDPAHLATVATKQSLAAIPMLPISDTYAFLKNSSTQFAQVGVGATISGIGIPLTMNNPDVRYKFPITFGTVDSSVAKYGAGFNGFGYYGEEVHRVNYVDGWGTLQLPGGTFNTIRVKSVVDYSDTVYLDTLGFGFRINRTEIEYKWLALELNVPILQITNRSGFYSILFYDGHPADYGISKNTNEPTLNLSPNPTNNMLTIDFSQEIVNPMICIYDVLGKQQYMHQFENCTQARVAVGAFLNGIYFIEIQASEANYHATFVKN